MKKSFLRGIIRTIAFLGWTLLLVPPYLLIFCLGRHVRRPMVQLWHRGVCALIGMKVTCYGKPSQNKRVLLAGNHVSYLDIPIIASCLDVTFVAKAEVADWPLFGFLAQIAQTAFIERKPSKARKQKVKLKQRILSGERLMIFPEGTSSPGNKVLPYKSALFEMVMENDLRETCLVQPVTLAFCRTRHHQPLNNTERDYFAWYGDMTLAPHLWDVFCLGGVEVDVIFHAPALAADFKDRKALAQWAQNRTSNGLSNLVTPSPECREVSLEHKEIAFT